MRLSACGQVLFCDCSETNACDLASTCLDLLPNHWWKIRPVPGLIGTVDNPATDHLELAKQSVLASVHWITEYKPLGRRCC